MANVALLAIQTVDQPPAGMNHLPEKFSYLSILAALGSIVVGLTVRSPRLFVSTPNVIAKALLDFEIDQCWRFLLSSYEVNAGIPIRTLPVQVR